MDRRDLLAALTGASLLTPFAWAGPIAERVQSTAGFVVPALTERLIATRMPKPQAIDSSGTCQATELRFESIAAMVLAGWTLPVYEKQLELWAVSHFGVRAASALSPQCSDGQFIARAWQAALLEPQTGVLTANQMYRLVAQADSLDRSLFVGKEMRAARDKGAHAAVLLAPIDTPGVPAAAKTAAGAARHAVYAFGFPLGAELALPACPPGNHSDFANVCAVPADADAVHPARVLEFERMTISAPHFPSQPGVPSDGFVMIMFPKQQRPEFLSDKRQGLRAVVANGRLEGVVGYPWIRFPMVAYFTEQYGQPTVARAGAGVEARLVYSFKTGNGMARIGCDPQGRICDVAQVLTDPAPALLERSVLELRRASSNPYGNSAGRAANEQDLAGMRERVRQQLEGMANQQQRDSARARQEEADETERVRRQNDQIRRQQEMLQEEERRRRNSGN